MKFYKLQASGNDFILIDNSRLKIAKKELRKIAQKYCIRKIGIGADGLLVIEHSKRSDFKMRIFNADGSEAEMCGNGARCATFWASYIGKIKNNTIFETKAGLIEAKIKRKNKEALVSIKMTDPIDLKLEIPLLLGRRKIKVNYVNTGVPHTVIFVEGLEKISVEEIGRKIRFHKRFLPQGTNVNFVEILKENLIKIRTYERGVEEETFACGTGAVASAVITTKFLKNMTKKVKVSVLTKSGEKLKVYFYQNETITNVWLEGKASLVYEGII
jgi:diaminopimelate epimerase